MTLTPEPSLETLLAAHPRFPTFARRNLPRLYRLVGGRASGSAAPPGVMRSPS